MHKLFCRYSVIYLISFFLDDCNYFSLFLREIRLITTFHPLFLSLLVCTWCVFLSSSPVSLAPYVTLKTPHLVPTLHVQYSLYECSHHTMYGTVGSLLGNCCGCLQGSVVLQLVGLPWFSAVFLKLGSSELRRFANESHVVPRDYIT